MEEPPLKDPEGPTWGEGPALHEILVLHREDEGNLLFIGNHPREKER